MMGHRISIPARDIAIAMGEDPERGAEILRLLSPQTCRLIRESNNAACHSYNVRIEALRREPS